MRKRIALVVNTLSGGGAERTVSNLSRALSGRYDVDIVVNDEEHLDYPYEGRIVSLQMPPEAKQSTLAYQLLALARRTCALRRLKGSGECVAAISFSEMTDMANVLSGSRRSRTIVSVRNSVNKRQHRGIKRRITLSLLMPFACRKADLVVSCSREIADDLMEHYGLSRQKSKVIYNGVELPRVRRMLEERLSSEEESRFCGQRLVVTVGRMTHQKGQWHLLKAMRKLKDDGLPVQLLLLGDGELRPALEEMVSELGLSDCVYLPGFVENPYKYMARADAVVMPSLHEGFCNAIVEAMACGAPVISTDHSTGAREILAPSTDYRTKTKDRIEECEFGVLVPVCEGDIQEALEATSPEEELMAEAIERVLTDEQLAERYREASRRRAGQLDITAACEQWIDAIEAKRAR